MFVGENRQVFFTKFLVKSKALFECGSFSTSFQNVKVISVRNNCGCFAQTVFLCQKCIQVYFILEILKRGRNGKETKCKQTK